MKKIFLTGGSGFLGWHVIKRLAGKYDLWCSKHASPLPENPQISAVPLDFENPASLKGVIKTIAPDVVIHLAAVSKTGVCEENPNLARRINVDVTSEILREIDPASTRMIHISTDLVFDGSRGFYNESDLPNPMMIYAETKFHAENLVRSWGKNHVVLRLALMYGRGSPSHGSFLSWLEKGLTLGSVVLFTDEYRTPLYVKDAASAIAALVESDFTGIMHLGGAQRCSRYEFGVEFALQKGYSTDVIIGKQLKDVSMMMYRPPDVSLYSSLAKTVLGINPCTIREGISDYLEIPE